MAGENEVLYIFKKNFRTKEYKVQNNYKSQALALFQHK